MREMVGEGPMLQQQGGKSSKEGAVDEAPRHRSLGKALEVFVVGRHGTRTGFGDPIVAVTTEGLRADEFRRRRDVSLCGKAPRQRDGPDFPHE